MIVDGSVISHSNDICYCALRQITAAVVCDSAPGHSAVLAQKQSTASSALVGRDKDAADLAEWSSKISTVQVNPIHHCVITGNQIEQPVFVEIYSRQALGIIGFAVYGSCHFQVTISTVASSTLADQYQVGRIRGAKHYIEFTVFVYIIQRNTGRRRVRCDDDAVRKSCGAITQIKFIVAIAASNDIKMTVAIDITDCDCPCRLAIGRDTDSTIKSSST